MSRLYTTYLIITHEDAASEEAAGVPDGEAIRRAGYPVQLAWQPLLWSLQ